MSALSHSSPGGEQARAQGRVLLVTDETPAPFYKRQLEDAGFVVVGVASGAAALVALRRTRPHVTIADMNLTGISASEFARLLAQAPEWMPLILVGTAQPVVARRIAAMESGASDYFQLPAELPLLITRVGQLVALKQTIDSLRAEANRDYLTGLANRRRFRVALGKELERWRRYRAPCSLLLMDVDFLKRINDTHGHSAGDRVIRHVASALLEQSRDNDTAARLGGEEFALLLANADEEQAIVAAERLRAAVAAVPVKGIGAVTISLGVAACPAHADTERTLYAAADAALYQAKRDGRNRACIAAGVEIS